MKTFINLSNHPSTHWGDTQREAALQLADQIIDIPFPNIPPTWDTEQVAQLATETIWEVSKKIGGADRRDVVIHVAGEPTFVVQFCQIISNEYRLVCSCTERVSVEKDGVKTSVFQFVRFRDLR